MDPYMESDRNIWLFFVQRNIQNVVITTYERVKKDYDAVRKAKKSRIRREQRCSDRSFI